MTDFFLANYDTFRCISDSWWYGPFNKNFIFLKNFATKFQLVFKLSFEPSVPWRVPSPPWLKRITAIVWLIVSVNSHAEITQRHSEQQFTSLRSLMAAKTIYSSQKAWTECSKGITTLKLSLKYVWLSSTGKTCGINSVCSWLYLWRTVQTIPTISSMPANDIMLSFITLWLFFFIYKTEL